MPTKPFTYASTQPEGRRERFRFQLYEQLRRPDFQFCAPNISKSFPPPGERLMDIDIIVEFFILSLFHHRKNFEVKFFLSIKQKKIQKNFKNSNKKCENCENFGGTSVLETGIHYSWTSILRIFKTGENSDGPDPKFGFHLAWTFV